MSATFTEQLQSDIREILGPLVKKYEDIDRQIAEMETTFNELRSARSQLAKVIRHIDPEAIPPPKYGPKRNGGKQPNKSGLSPERVEGFHTFLKEHADHLNAQNDGRGFYAGGLFREYGRDELGLPDSSVSIAIKKLYEQGLLRRTGQGNGGAIFYHVIA